MWYQWHHLPCACMLHESNKVVPVEHEPVRAMCMAPSANKNHLGVSTVHTSDTMPILQQSTDSTQRCIPQPCVTKSLCHTHALRMARYNKHDVEIDCALDHMIGSDLSAFDLHMASWVNSWNATEFVATYRASLRT